MSKKAKKKDDCKPTATRVQNRAILRLATDERPVFGRRPNSLSRSILPALLALLLLLGAPAHAAWMVTGLVNQVTSAALDTAISFHPGEDILLLNNGLSGGPAKTIYSTNGAFSVTLDAGNYLTRLPLITSRNPFTISVPHGTGTTDITNLIAAPWTYEDFVNTIGGSSGPTNGLTQAQVSAAISSGTNTFNGAGLITNAQHAVAADSATAALGGTNVYYGGSVTTSNVLTKIASGERTNANAFMGYGGLQLSTAVYGQSATGNYNYRNGVEFLGAGWDGTPIDYSDLANHPSGFIHVLTNWGGSTGFNSLVLHIATPGAIRLEPNYGEPTFGVGYLTLGNEDGNAKVFINDVNQSTTNGVDGKGYSQPLYFSTKGINGGTERTATPAIMGRWAGTNSGAGAYEGWYAAELSFMSRGPTADTDWPTFGRLFPTQTIEVGRMRTNGWQFFGPVNLVQSTVTLQATNVVLDFNSASSSDIALASGVTNRFSTVNVNAYGGTTNLEQRWFRIRSGGLDTPLQWPTWSVGSESGASTLPTVLPATNILFLRLSSWGSGDTNVVADWRMSPDTTFAYDSDAVTFFTAASITDATQKGAVDYLVKSLKAGNLWTNMIAVYPFVGGASNKHALNLKAPSTYPITFTSTGVTHDGSGITGDGSSGYGAIPLDWTSAIGGSAISNFHVAVYNKTTTPTDGRAFIGGRNGSSVGVGLTRESASVGVRGAMNSLGPNAIVNLSTDLRGALIETRANSTAAFEIATRLGVTSTSSDSTAVPTTNPYLLAYNFNGSASLFTTANLTYASLGYGFTPAELTNLVYILDNYDRARSATTIPYNYVYTGSGSGLTSIPASAMAGGSQGQVVTWHGSGAIWSNPPAGGSSFTLTMNPNQFAQAGGTTNIKSGATMTNINQWGNFVLRSEDASNDITVTNHSQKLKINSTANPYTADTEIGEDIKTRTFYGASNNISGGISAGSISTTTLTANVATATSIYPIGITNKPLATDTAGKIATATGAQIGAQFSGGSTYLKADGTTGDPSGGTTFDTFGQNEIILENFYGSPSTTFVVGQLGLGYIANSGANAQNDGEVGHNGIYQLSTSTSASSAPILGQFTVGKPFVTSSGSYTQEWIFRLPILPTADEGYETRIGFGSSQTAAVPADAIYFVHNTNDTHFVLVTRNDTSETRATNTTVVAANTWYTNRLTVIGDTAAYLTVNGADQISITTTLPSGAGDPTAIFAQIVKSNGTTARTLQLDSLKFGR